MQTNYNHKGMFSEFQPLICKMFKLMVHQGYKNWANVPDLLQCFHFVRTKLKMAPL